MQNIAEMVQINWTLLRHNTSQHVTTPIGIRGCKWKPEKLDDLIAGSNTKVSFQLLIKRFTYIQFQIYELFFQN